MHRTIVKSRIERLARSQEDSLPFRQGPAKHKAPAASAVLSPVQSEPRPHRPSSPRRRYPPHLPHSDWHVPEVDCCQALEKQGLSPTPSLQPSTPLFPQPSSGN